MKLHMLILTLLLGQSACAQSASPVQQDSASVQPGTVRVVASVISSGKNKAMLRITSVVATGQGIVNILSEGQEIAVQFQEAALKPGDKIEADLKEKMGIDASQSSYLLLRFNKHAKN